MTVKDVIKLLKLDIAMAVFDPATGETLTLEQLRLRCSCEYEIVVALLEAVSLLQKQIPVCAMELGLFDDYINKTYVQCPTCKSAVIRHSRFCGYCGQRLEYSSHGESVG